MDPAEAMQRAQQSIQVAARAGLTPVLIPEQASENCCFYVFPYNSREWLENSEFDKLLMTGPVVVDKQTGQCWLSSGALTIQDYLSELEDSQELPHDPLHPLVFITKA